MRTIPGAALRFSSARMVRSLMIGFELIAKFSSELAYSFINSSASDILETKMRMRHRRRNVCSAHASFDVVRFPFRRFVLRFSNSLNALNFTLGRAAAWIFKRSLKKTPTCIVSLRLRDAYSSYFIDDKDSFLSVGTRFARTKPVNQATPTYIVFFVSFSSYTNSHWVLYSMGALNYICVCHD